MKFCNSDLHYNLNPNCNLNCTATLYCNPNHNPRLTLLPHVLLVLLPPQLLHWVRTQDDWPEVGVRVRNLSL